jgi:putative pyruvate formate lyase activating enzyme
MNAARNILSTYFEILEENATPRYIQCKHIPVSYHNSESTDDLWKKHDHAVKTLNMRDVPPKQSLLDLKIELAQRIFQNCCFCERRCNIDRRKKAGDCGVQEAWVASEFLHMGEESVLIPSYTVFFSGCTFHCVFCQNWDISQQHVGIYVQPHLLADMIQRRQNQGARNVNWVGGDPTSNLLYILTVLKTCKVNIPQVWNSNMYCSLETMKLLDGVIDVYLTDFKYGNDQCAQRFSKAANYTSVMQRNHQLAYQQTGVIIRHLVLPGHVTCCSKPILMWIKKHMPDSLVNVMAQYRPQYKAHEYDTINRSLTHDEFLQAKQYAEDLQLYEV